MECYLGVIGILNNEESLIHLLTGEFTYGKPFFQENSMAVGFENLGIHFTNYH